MSFGFIFFAFANASLNVTLELPALYEYWDDAMVREGKALNGRGPAPGANPVMNCAARE